MESLGFAAACLAALFLLVILFCLFMTVACMADHQNPRDFLIPLPKSVGCLLACLALAAGFERGSHKIRVDLWLDQERQQLLLRRNFFGLTMIRNLANFDDLFALSISASGSDPDQTAIYFITSRARTIRASDELPYSITAPRGEQLARRLGLLFVPCAEPTRRYLQVRRTQEGPVLQHRARSFLDRFFRTGVELAGLPVLALVALLAFCLVGNWLGH